LKPLKLKKCCICKTEFKAFMSTTKVCSIDCAIKHAEKKKIALEKKRIAIHKRDCRIALDAIKPKSKWLKEAQIEFNRYIRLRDANKPCISCQRHHKGQYHAGHYRTVGSAPHLRFDERNCYKQCSVCNNHLSGNIINYRISLVQLFGIDYVNQLENDNEAKHYTVDDIKEIKAYYKAKCKELENV